MIGAIVLAAGLSSRMGGRPKALLPIGGVDMFVTRIVRTLRDAGVDEIVVVIGYQAARVRAVVEGSGLGARVVVNRQFEQGQFSSIVAGLVTLARPEIHAVLLALVDAPLFDASTVRAIIDRFHHTRAPVVRAVRGSQHGHPVLISATLFDQLLGADPLRGAKPVIRGHASSTGDVSVEDPGAFIDIDTPEEYATIIGPFPSDG
jgi:molybdenum cofactor cytidylyltransferase